MDLTLEMVFYIVRRCLAEKTFSFSWVLSKYWTIWIGYWTAVLNKIMALFRHKCGTLRRMKWSHFWYEILDIWYHSISRSWGLDLNQTGNLLVAATLCEKSLTATVGFLRLIPWGCMTIIAQAQEKYMEYMVYILYYFFILYFLYRIIYICIILHIRLDVWHPLIRQRSGSTTSTPFVVKGGWEINRTEKWRSQEICKSGDFPMSRLIIGEY